MSQQISCEQCGGFDFALENGFYFCQECHFLSQDVREQHMEAMYSGSRVSQMIGVTKAATRESLKQDRAKKEIATGVSSWELFNFVLKGLVDELITLGAPKRLKTITLQLWVSYLNKIEVAFTSTSNKKKPKLGVYFDKKNAAIFYDDEGNSFDKFSKKTYRRSSMSLNESRQDETNAKNSKQKFLSSKRSLAQVEYTESIAESSINSSFNMSASLASLGSQSSKFSGRCADKNKYSSHGKREILEFLHSANDDVLKRHKMMRRRGRKGPYYTSLIKTISLLRIALLLSGSDIHLGDLNRWSDDKRLSFHCLIKFIPPELDSPAARQLVNNPAIDVRTLLECSENMAKFLSVPEDAISPSDIIMKLVERYSKLLCLPTQVSLGIGKMLNVHTPTISLTVASNYEARAMALILFSLKILIGLDEVTEFTYKPREEDNVLKWNDWSRRRVGRMAVEALHNYPNLQSLYPGSYVGGSKAFFSHYKEAALSRVIQYDKNVLFRTITDSFTKTMQQFMCPEHELQRPSNLESDPDSEAPLAILSKRNRNKKSIGLKKALILAPRDHSSPVTEKSQEKLFVKFSNDERPASVRASQPFSHLFHIRENYENVDPLPDNKIWALNYHLWKKPEQELRFGSDYQFKEFAAQHFPHSFHWLLNEMARIIYQPPRFVYLELLRVEKVFTNCKKIRGHFDCRW